MENTGTSVLKSGSVWLIVIGALSLIGGLLALVNPFAATLAVVALAGWLFIIFGVLQIVHAFSLRGWGGFLWALLFGIVAVLLGISLLRNPVAGMISLTMLVGILFLVMGVIKIMYSFSWRPAPGWGMALLSGIVSIILAVMIFANFPQSAAVMLGILLAVELLSNGVFLVMAGFAVRRQ